MAKADLLELLDKKSQIIEAVSQKTNEQNRLILSNQFSNMAEIDAAKEDLIKELLITDNMISALKTIDRETSEKARDKMQKINSSLNYLIKLEKENETLLEQANRSFSGEYIKAYKTYKLPK
jgi:hypothetical protein